MTPRSKSWFDEAIRKGVDAPTAYIGTEIIDGWSKFWEHDISEANLKEMIDFAVSCPDAALHRWSIIAGPRPWIPHPSIVPFLKQDPTWSTLEDLKRQRIAIQKPGILQTFVKRLLSRLKP